MEQPAFSNRTENILWFVMHEFLLFDCHPEDVRRAAVMARLNTESDPVDGTLASASEIPKMVRLVQMVQLFRN